MKILQIALDLLSIEDAIVIAKKAYISKNIWLEVGTPLIKTHGVLAIKRLREKFPNATIVADMKTMDTGDLEVELAVRNGANIVSIMGVASIETIKRATNRAKELGAKIMVDLMEIKDLKNKIQELRDIDIDYFLIHMPIDVQKAKRETVKAFLNNIKELREILDKPLAIAGGINLDSIKILKDYADIFIVGSAITKAYDIERTVKSFLKILGHEVEIEKIDIDLLEEFEKYSTCNISDAMKKYNTVGKLRCLNPRRVAGYAVTVKLFQSDWSKVFRAIEVADNKSILVIQSDTDYAVFGELATLNCIKKGIRAVIVYGSIRDVEEIKAMKFPVWYKNINPAAGDARGKGEINVEICIDNTIVRPGDIIVADENGVVIIPKNKAYEVLEKTKLIKEKEEYYKKEILKGKNLSEIFAL